jgi:two-component system, cell cycle sensor histidine kinase and response regulator CckA
MKNRKPVVLVIDDEKPIRDSICNYLEDGGYDVLGAGDGLEGLEIFERKNPDLVLLDLRMPEMDGLDALSMLRERSPDTPIIVVSGKGRVDDAIEALRLGAWDYLIKPIKDLSALRHSMDMALERAHLIQENRMYQEKLEAQFRQAQKMESIGRLAGGVAHDFNNLLTPILGYTEMLLFDFSPDDPRYDKLVQIQKAAERAESLARQLLAFSRKQVLETKKVDLCQVVSGFEKILRSTIREDIELHIKIVPLPCNIKADVSQIEQILMNLLVNAQDAMPDGGRIVIEIAEVFLDEAYASAHSGLQPGHYVMLTVGDTGCGMDSETLKHAFEPFFTTKERGKGTGLGLSTVYGIIQQHGGNIWVDSKPGRETTFTICFPPTDEIPEHTTVHSSQKEILNGNETVLVVEDDDAVRNLVCNILTQQSYWVIGAENADECLSLVKQHKSAVHLLITDVVMPKMNGKELYQQLTPMFPDLKVLYMSGYADDVIGHHGVLEEGVHFLKKPVSVHALTGKVRAVLDG